MDIDSLWNFGDPAATEQRFREALSATNDTLIQGELHTQIARTLGLRKRFDECDQELNIAEELIDGRKCRGEVRRRLESGRRLNSSGNAAASVQWFDQARQLAAELGEVGLEIDAIHMLAIADTERAMEWNLLALAKAEQTDDPRGRKWLASLYNNIGWTHFDNGNVEEALALFEKAVPIREQMGNEENTRVAKWCVARTLRELGRVADAKTIMSELHALQPDGEFNNQEMALLLVAEGHIEEAKPYAEKALAILEQDDWMLKNRADIISALRSIVTG